jgi:hypothetical protein
MSAGKPCAVRDCRRLVLNQYSQLAKIVAGDGKVLDAGLNSLADVMTSYAAGHPSFDPAATGAAMPAELQSQLAAWY